MITEDEADIMRSAISPVAVALPLEMKEALCAGTMRSMVLALAKRKEKN